MQSLDIYELYILSLFRRENVVIIKEGRTKNLVDKGYITVIGRNKLKERVVLTELGKRIQNSSVEDFDDICMKSCVKFLKSLNGEEILLIEKICSTENKRLEKYFRIPRQGQVRHKYYSFFSNLENSIFMMPTIGGEQFAVSAYGVEAYEEFKSD